MCATHVPCAMCYKGLCSLFQLWGNIGGLYVLLVLLLSMQQQFWLSSGVLCPRRATYIEILLSPFYVFLRGGFLKTEKSYSPVCPVSRRGRKKEKKKVRETQKGLAILRIWLLSYFHGLQGEIKSFSVCQLFSVFISANLFIGFQISGEWQGMFSERKHQLQMHLRVTATNNKNGFELLFPLCFHFPNCW